MTTKADFQAAELEFLVPLSRIIREDGLRCRIAPTGTQIPV